MSVDSVWALFLMKLVRAARPSMSLELGTAFGISAAFIDAGHNEAATIAYLDQIGPFLTTGALIVFDDIRLSAEMKRAWAVVESDARMGLTADLGRMGIAVFGAGRSA
jgi:predicted O-methyltransferase YrrM